MGKMVLIYKISPEGIEKTDKVENAIKEKIKDLGELKDIKREPIAFGLEAIKIAIVVEAKGTEGITEKIENTLKEIEGVSSVENIGMNLL
ncbi:MAG: elongation factor 1-beta [Candidatus Diapherotrites archaeon CG_4_10_14_0_2_um_filter_31_5]|nr:MAG: elongation factor 1-beta [Candidatus Diapherotrites archaeon CG_4_10_14_0_2_um_filter_31_5]